MGQAKLKALDSDIVWLCMQNGQGTVYTCARQKIVVNPILKKESDASTQWLSPFFIGLSNT